MKQIQFKVIPHRKQRYETVGDYFEDARGRIQFRVSDMRNPDYEFLVALHEFIEWYLVQRAGIKITDIDAFDKKFERERLLGLHKPDDEPGHDPAAPYGWAHKFAEKIERMAARKLGIRWAFYDITVTSL